MSERLPNKVPLPEVPEYTDDIVFGHLMLPTGFDEDRLLVNLRGLERVRTIAGLGQISVVGEAGEAGQIDYQMNSFNSSGVATLRGAAKREKKPLSSSTVTFPTHSPVLGKPSVTISLNSAETQERIRDKSDKFDKGVFDPRARALFLNKAIKEGLYKADRDANFTSEGLLVGGVVYGMVGVMDLIMYLTGDITAQTAAGLSVLAPPLMFETLAQVTAPYRTYKFRHSAFVGVSLDRWYAANSLVKVTKFVRARK